MNGQQKKRHYIPSVARLSANKMAREVCTKDSNVGGTENVRLSFLHRQDLGRNIVSEVCKGRWAGKGVCDVWGSSRDADLPLKRNACCCCLVLIDKIRQEPAPRPFRAPDQLLHQQAVALRLAREGRHRWGVQVDPQTAPALVRPRRKVLSFICPLPSGSRRPPLLAPEPGRIARPNPNIRQLSVRLNSHRRCRGSMPLHCRPLPLRRNGRAFWFGLGESPSNLLPVPFPPGCVGLASVVGRNT